MADKNFKVKSGLQVPSLTTAGPVTTDSSGNVTSSATLPITQGGTGQTTAGNALNALLPLQTSQDNKFLQTNGVSTQWTIPQQQTSTDGTLGYKVYSGTVTPSSPVTGDIWIDQTTGNGIQLVRWRKTIASTTTTLTALDDNNLTLSYTAGNEQVYINGTLITRGQDYTATNGTSVVLVQAAEVGDTIEIFGNPLFSVTDVYTQAQANSLYVRNSNYPVAGKNKIINGDFGINQRNFTSVTSSGAYHFDRWTTTNVGTGNTISLTPRTFTSGAAPVSGYEGKNYLEYTTASGSNTNTASLLKQRIESVRSFAGETVTVSFWAKTNSGTPSIAPEFVQTFGTGGSAAVNSILSTSPKQTISTSWQRYSWVVQIPSVINKTIGADTDSLELNIWLSAGTDYASRASSIGIQNSTFHIWGVQVEPGSVPTSFSTSTGTFAGELSACQRYYQRWTTNAWYAGYMTGYSDSTTTGSFVWQLTNTMRIPPSFAASSASVFLCWTTGNQAITALTLDSATTNSIAFYVTYNNTVTAGQGVRLRNYADNTSYLEASAEL